jgi:hypothetical protein
MTKNGSFEFYHNYSDSVQNLQPEFYCEIKKILNKEFNSFTEKYKRKPIVLDIGSAGLLPYNVDLTKKVVILDLFDKPRQLDLDKSCEWITGDILSDSVIPELLKIGKFDFIIMSCLLHHLCDDSNNIQRNLKTNFVNSHLLLSENGKFVYLKVLVQIV